jgi:hypothetical protein
VSVVFAGRHSPGAEWVHDPAWSQLLRSYRLPSLTEAEARALLDSREVPPADHDELVGLARGHALTLASLAAEGPEARRLWVAGARELAELGNPLDRDEQRAILALCLRHWVNERDLVRAVGTAAFLPALERHAYIERVGSRWRIHDLYRAGFLSRCRVELADELPAIVRRSVRTILGRVREERDYDVRQRLLFEVGFIIRAMPPGDFIFDRFHDDPHYRDSLRQDDIPIIVAAIRRAEGAESAALASAHLNRFPDLCVVLRDITEAPLGAVVWMDVQRLTAADAARDPAARKLLELKQATAPDVPEFGPQMARWWLTIDGYQEPSAELSHLMAYVSSSSFAREGGALHAQVVHTLTSASGDTWLELGLLDRFDDLAFNVGGHTYTVVGYDFRAEQRHERMLRDIERMLEISATVGVEGPLLASAPPRQLTLPRPPELRGGLSAAVAEALRWYRHDGRLSQVELAHPFDEGTTLERANRVRALLNAAHARLPSTGRSPDPATLITHAYFERAEKQLTMASDLGMTLGTFRRWLRDAVELLAACVESIWAEAER